MFPPGQMHTRWGRERSECRTELKNPKLNKSTNPLRDRPDVPVRHAGSSSNTPNLVPRALLFSSCGSRDTLNRTGVLVVCGYPAPWERRSPPRVISDFPRAAPYLSSRLSLGDAEGLDWASSVTSEMMGPELAEESGEYRLEPLYAGEEACNDNRSIRAGKRWARTARCPARGDVGTGPNSHPPQEGGDRGLHTVPRNTLPPPQSTTEKQKRTSVL